MCGQGEGEPLRFLGLDLEVIMGGRVLQGDWHLRAAVVLEEGAGGKKPPAVKGKGRLSGCHEPCGSSSAAPRQAAPHPQPQNDQVILGAVGAGTPSSAPRLHTSPWPALGF